MAVTAAGTPYVESSDLVANYPGASLSLANRVDQVMQAPTQNAQTGTTYTAVLLDAGKTVTLSNAAAVTLTIPAQASVSWADNTQLNFLNLGAGTVTITAAAGVTINGTPLTLATSKGGSLVRTASNTWTFTPTGGGGKILQVIQGTTTTTTSSSSSAYADTALTATITPSLSTSKVLVQISVAGVSKNANTGVGLKITRDAVIITEEFGGQVGYTGTSLVTQNSVSTSFLDSPAATTALVYKLQMNSMSNIATAFVNRNILGAINVSTITLMEIAS